MRRLNVALSRAKHKVIVVAATQVLDYIASDSRIQLHAQSWKHYRQQWCTEILWEGEFGGQFVRVRGGNRTSNENPVRNADGSA